MPTAKVPPHVLGEAAAGLAEVAAEFTDELGGPPTLAEFLELLGWAIPTNSEALDGTFTSPLRFKAALTGNKPYRTDAPSRVPELNDHLFEDARTHLGDLAERMHDAADAPVTPAQLAAAILKLLQSGEIVLADVAAKDVRKLIADLPRKRIARPRAGDVLAIPASSGGYHMAVVLVRNRFGTALGLFRGTSPQGRLDAGLRRAARKYPVYTGVELVMNGTWKVVDHDDSLLALFPADPPIYHQPNAEPDVDNGAFGAAETSEGTVRLIGPDEAREVGLADGTYQVVILPPYLQTQLDVEDERS